MVFGRQGGFTASFNLAELNGSNGFAINGINSDDQSGGSVSGAGDVNGDRIDDLIIGAKRADPNGSDSGQSYVVFGRQGEFSASLNLSELDGSNGFALNGVSANDASGGSVSGAGDINGDGIDDLIIGAAGADANGNFDAGQSYVVFGRQGGFIPLVDTLVDENDGDLSPGDVSLREAIALAGNGATIAFSSTLSGGAINLTLGELAIDRNITIEGLGENNLTISGSNESRIFRIGGNTEVNINGLTIADGFALEDGGAIDNRGILNLNNSTIRDSVASDDGGGIHNLGTLRLNNSTIENNIAEDDGGGIGNFNGTVEATNSIFSNNAASSDGGGIFNFNGTLEITSSTLTENAVDTGNGGGIRSFRGTTSVNNTIVAGNIDAGGERPDVDGIFTSNGFNLIGIGDGSTGFSNGDIVGTRNNPIDPQLSDLENHHAPQIGSPVIDAGDPNITGSDRIGNSRPQGVGVDIGAVEFQFSDRLTVDTAIDEFDGDLTPGDVSLREAIFATSSGGTIDFAASLSGSAIGLTLGTLTLNKNLTIQGLGADNLTLDGNNNFRIFSIEQNANVDIRGLSLANASNSAILNFGTLNLSESIVRDSRGRFAGGINNQGSLTVVNSIIRNNQDEEREGGSGIGNFGTATLQGSTVSNNLNGGIFNASSGNLTIDNSTISDHISHSGIRNLGNLTVTDSTISNNNNVGDGGGINNFGTLNLNNSTISGNLAGFGGGIFNDSSSTFTIANSTIANNTARNSGGGIFSQGLISETPVVTPQIGNSIIAGNISAVIPDVDGRFTSNGFNLIGNGNGSSSFISGVNGDIVGTPENPIDPRLSPLQDNGGATFTHALLANSPAANAGNNDNLPADTEDLDGDGDISEPLPVDQRGITRIQNGIVDIGAFESDIETRPIIRFVATDAEADENGDVGIYTLTRNETNGELTVNLSVDEDSTASFSEDYTLEVNGIPIAPNNGNFNITFVEGESEVTIRLIPVDDVLAEDAETVMLNLSENLEYAIAPDQNTATVTIAANDLTAVNNTNDSGIGSLRQAILNANANLGTDTITFEGDIFADNTPDIITLTSGELQITDSLTIQGLGANNLTISGNNASRVLNIDNNNASQINVAIDGLTISGGNTTGNGGGIFNRENLKISNSNIRNNTAANGGGISTVSGTLDITDSAIDSNTSRGVGGGIQQQGNAIVNITNSTINNNTSNSNGAGIDANPSPGGFAVTVTNSNISGNTSNNGSGGGISLGSNALVNVSDSNVTNNRATVGFGGGIANRFGGQLNLERAFVATNTAANNPDISGTANSRGFNIIGNGTGLTGITNGVNNDIVGAVSLGDRVYFLTPTATSWQNARAIARSFGGNLVTINNAAENSFLTSQFGSQRPWIGLNDEAIEGQFQWVNGEPVTFTNWASGEPNNFGSAGEDFAELSSNGRWNDLPTTSQRRGIVEIDLNLLGTSSSTNESNNLRIAIPAQSFAVSPASTRTPVETPESITEIDEIVPSESVATPVEDSESITEIDEIVIPESAVTPVETAESIAEIDEIVPPESAAKPVETSDSRTEIDEIMEGRDILTGGGSEDKFIHTCLMDAGDILTNFQVGRDKQMLTQQFDPLDTLNHGGITNLMMDDRHLQFAVTGTGKPIEIDLDELMGNRIFRPFRLVENITVAGFDRTNNF
ncbi:MAG: hypothetical protein HC941_22430 [Microcoleus sp. SU_5_3]|nr:hypothetical protein [Microcoleus sp. SU_5_3]